MGSPSTTTLWTYDKLDRTATMNDGTRGYSYDANGNVLQMQVYNSGSATVAVTSGYDGGNRLTSQTDAVGSGGTTLHSYSYTYDGNGNRSAITEDGTTTTYTYDGDKQLTQITDSAGATVLATYTYDANHNRTSLVTSAGTTTYTYDSADVLLTSKTDPNGKVTQYAYDTLGNLLTATYDPTGANQVTTYHYDTNNRLTEVDNPTGSTVTFTYDANGNRTSKTFTTSGPTPTTTVVTDVYQQGHIAYQTDGSGTVLATFTYDPNGVPESVTVGSDPTTAPRYYYVYNGHGDVVALTDASGTTVAAYAYDVFGTLTSTLETFSNWWSNPYCYDGRDGVRYDSETGLYWMSVRAYDPTLGQFARAACTSSCASGPSS